MPQIEPKTAYIQLSEKLGIGTQEAGKIDLVNLQIG